MDGILSIMVGGLRVAYRRQGEGTPLVLLHGVLADHRTWHQQFDALSSSFDVVAWDAPGCGASSDPPETFSLADYADCLAGFIEALELEKPHVLGLSWGGGLALQLCARRPTLPKTLILSGAYAGWAGSLPEDVVAQRLESCLKESTLAPSEFIPNWIPTLLTRNAPPQLKADVTSEMSDSFHPVGYRAMVRAFADADLRPSLQTIGVPTLLLYGDEDVRAPLNVAQELHSNIRDSELVILPGVGHLSNVEGSDEFNAEVIKFLG